MIIHESLPDVRLRQSPDLTECTPPASRSMQGESPDEQATCAKRLDHVFAENFKASTTADRNDLIIAHGNVIRYLVTKALGVDTRAWIGFSVAHVSLTVIRVRADGTMSVNSVGDMGHLPPSLQSWGPVAAPRPRPITVSLSPLKCLDYNRSLYKGPAVLWRIAAFGVWRLAALRRQLLSHWTT